MTIPNELIVIAVWYIVGMITGYIIGRTSGKW